MLRRQLVLARARVQSGLRDLALLLLKALLVDALGRGHKQVAAWRRQDLVHAETETERTQKKRDGMARDAPMSKSDWGNNVRAQVEIARANGRRKAE